MVCDRSKTEVLARELAIEFFNGFHQGSQEATPMSKEAVVKNVEQNWQTWERHATKLIVALEKHND